ncbi:MAG TPA: hypothetical protein VFC93_11870 [Chloroflexota bacterium]|nr:hypothetical protein [Chloroflexota bacterium]
MTAPRPKVLLLAEDAQRRSALARALGDDGLEVVADAAFSPAALLWAQDSKPDLIVLAEPADAVGGDLHKQFVATLQWLAPDRKRWPVFVLLGRADEAAARDALRAGASAVVWPDAADARPGASLLAAWDAFRSSARDAQDGTSGKQFIPPTAPIGAPLGGTMRSSPPGERPAAATRHEAAEAPAAAPVEPVVAPPASVEPVAAALGLVEPVVGEAPREARGDRAEAAGTAAAWVASPRARLVVAATAAVALVVAIGAFALRQPTTVRPRLPTLRLGAALVEGAGDRVVPAARAVETAAPAAELALATREREEPSPTAQPPPTAEPSPAERPTTQPSPTPATVSATATPLATASPSAQPTSSPTPPPSATAVETPVVVLDERFADNRLGWPNDARGTAWLTRGAYHFAVRQPGRFVAVGVKVGQALSDVIVTGVFRKVGGPSGGGYGVIVRDQSPSPGDGVEQTGRYYVLEAGDKGEVGIWRRDEDHWVDLLPWTQSSAVHPGGERNELTVRAVGRQIALSVNGTDVASVEDAALDGGGVGVFVGGDANEVVLERLTVQRFG